MTGLSSKGEIAVLGAILTGCYVSLHSADPGDTGTSEVSGGAYARQTAAFSNTGANPTTASNSSIVSFPVATVAWGTLPYFGVWDAVSGGNFRGSGALSPAAVVNIGDQARFLAGALTVTAQ
jgi:hypothetical protein